MFSFINPSLLKAELISRLLPFKSAINTWSAILKASLGSLPFVIPNIQVQATTPNERAIQSSFPISSQGNLKDSSIFF